MPPPDLRATLAANLRRMIAAGTPEGEKPSVNAWAQSKGLSVRLIDRLSKGEHAVTLDKLDEIAEACGLKPWQLLLEDLDPKNPPEAPVTEDERRMLTRLRKLLDG